MHVYALAETQVHCALGWGQDFAAPTERIDGAHHPDFGYLPFVFIHQTVFGCHYLGIFRNSEKLLHEIISPSHKPVLIPLALDPPVGIANIVSVRAGDRLVECSPHTDSHFRKVGPAEGNVLTAGGGWLVYQEGGQLQGDQVDGATGAEELEPEGH